MPVPLVVDADGHCQEPEEGLAQWMPRDLAGRVVPKLDLTLARGD